MDIKRNLVTAAATGALLLSAFAVPAFADTTIQVSGNGSMSDNSANVLSSQSNTVVQNNTAKINNSVDTHSSTGGNSASGNTGGDVLIGTGDANSTTNIRNQANLNQATLNNCGCSSDQSIKISGNGTDSLNTATLKNSNTTSAFQNNNADISNSVDNHLKTGDNTADNNTASSGGGMVTVITGNASSNTSLTNKANANILSTGSNGSSGSSSVNATISGNGSGSYNSAYLTDSNNTTAVQNGNADIRNHVKNWLETGDNSANSNTGSDVAIGTGNANATTSIDNMANFNIASLAGCGCLTGVNAKVAGNGTGSTNTMTFGLNDGLSLFQGSQNGTNPWWSSTNFDNSVHGGGSTGDNSANSSTAPVIGDPVRVFTGNSSSNTTLSNQGGVNWFGPLSSIQLPGGTSLNFDFNLSSLLGSM